MGSMSSYAPVEMSDVVQIDPELEAMQRVLSAVEALSPIARTRVMAWVNERCMPPAKVSVPIQRPAGSTM